MSTGSVQQTPACYPDFGQSAPESSTCDPHSGNQAISTKTSRFAESQIALVLKQAEDGKRFDDRAKDMVLTLHRAAQQSPARRRSR